MRALNPPPKVTLPRPPLHLFAPAADLGRNQIDNLQRGSDPFPKSHIGDLGRDQRSVRIDDEDFDAAVREEMMRLEASFQKMIPPSAADRSSDGRSINSAGNMRPRLDYDDRVMDPMYDGYDMRTTNEPVMVVKNNFRPGDIPPKDVVSNRYTTEAINSINAEPYSAAAVPKFTAVASTAAAASVSAYPSSQRSGGIYGRDANLEKELRRKKQEQYRQQLDEEQTSNRMKSLIPNENPMAGSPRGANYQQDVGFLPSSRPPQPQVPQYLQQPINAMPPQAPPNNPKFVEARDGVGLMVGELKSSPGEIAQKRRERQQQYAQQLRADAQHGAQAGSAAAEDPFSRGRRRVSGANAGPYGQVEAHPHANLGAAVSGGPSAVADDRSSFSVYEKEALKMKKKRQQDEYRQFLDMQMDMKKLAKEEEQEQQRSRSSPRGIAPTGPIAVPAASPPYGYPSSYPPQAQGSFPGPPAAGAPLPTHNAVMHGDYGAYQPDVSAYGRAGHIDVVRGVPGAGHAGEEMRSAYPNYRNESGYDGAPGYPSYPVNESRYPGVPGYPNYPNDSGYASAAPGPVNSAYVHRSPVLFQQNQPQYHQPQPLDVVSPTKARARMAQDVYGGGSASVLAHDTTPVMDPNWRPSGKGSVTDKQKAAIAENRRVLEAQIEEKRRLKEEEKQKEREEEEKAIAKAQEKQRAAEEEMWKEKEQQRQLALAEDRKREEERERLTQEALARKNKGRQLPKDGNGPVASSGVAAGNAVSPSRRNADVGQDRGPGTGAGGPNMRNSYDEDASYPPQGRDEESRWRAERRDYRYPPDPRGRPAGYDDGRGPNYDGAGIDRRGRGAPYEQRDNDNYRGRDGGGDRGEDYSYYDAPRGGGPHNHVNEQNDPRRGPRTYPDEPPHDRPPQQYHQPQPLDVVSPTKARARMAQDVYGGGSASVLAHDTTPLMDPSWRPSGKGSVTDKQKAAIAENRRVLEAQIEEKRRLKEEEKQKEREEEEKAIAKAQEKQRAAEEEVWKEKEQQRQLALAEDRKREEERERLTQEALARKNRRSSNVGTQQGSPPPRQRDQQDAYGYDDGRQNDRRMNNGRAVPQEPYDQYDSYDAQQRSPRHVNRELQPRREEGAFYNKQHNHHSNHKPSDEPYRSIEYSDYQDAPANHVDYTVGENGSFQARSPARGSHSHNYEQENYEQQIVPHQDYEYFASPSRRPNHPVDPQARGLGSLIGRMSVAGSAEGVGASLHNIGASLMGGRPSYLSANGHSSGGAPPAAVAARGNNENRSDVQRRAATPGGQLAYVSRLTDDSSVSFSRPATPHIVNLSEGVGGREGREGRYKGNMGTSQDDVPSYRGFSLEGGESGEIFRPSSPEEVDNFLAQWQKKQQREKSSLREQEIARNNVERQKSEASDMSKKRPGSGAWHHKDKATLISEIRGGGDVKAKGGLGPQDDDHAHITETEEGEGRFPSESRLVPSEGMVGQGLYAADALVRALGMPSTLVSESSLMSMNKKPPPESPLQRPKRLQNEVQKPPQGNGSRLASREELERSLAGESLLLQINAPVSFNEDHLSTILEDQSYADNSLQNTAHSDVATSRQAAAPESSTLSPNGLRHTNRDPSSGPQGSGRAGSMVSPLSRLMQESDVRSAHIAVEAASRPQTGPLTGNRPSSSRVATAEKERERFARGEDALVSLLNEDMSSERDDTKPLDSSRLPQGRPRSTSGPQRTPDTARSRSIYSPAGLQASTSRPSSGPRRDRPQSPVSVRSRQEDLNDTSRPISTPDRSISRVSSGTTSRQASTPDHSARRPPTAPTAAKPITSRPASSTVSGADRPLTTAGRRHLQSRGSTGSKEDYQDESFEEYAAESDDEELLVIPDTAAGHTKNTAASLVYELTPGTFDAAGAAANVADDSDDDDRRKAVLRRNSSRNRGSSGRSTPGHLTTRAQAHSQIPTHVPSRSASTASVPAIPPLSTDTAYSSPRPDSAMSSSAYSADFSATNRSSSLAGGPYEGGRSVGQSAAKDSRPTTGSESRGLTERERHLLEEADSPQGISLWGGDHRKSGSRGDRRGTEKEKENEEDAADEDMSKVYEDDYDSDDGEKSYPVSRGSSRGKPSTASNEALTRRPSAPPPVVMNSRRSSANSARGKADVDMIGGDANYDCDDAEDEPLATRGSSRGNLSSAGSERMRSARGSVQGGNISRQPSTRSNLGKEEPPEANEVHQVSSRTSSARGRNSHTNTPGEYKSRPLTEEDSHVSSRSSSAASQSSVPSLTAQSSRRHSSTRSDSGKSLSSSRHQSYREGNDQKNAAMNNAASTNTRTPRKDDDSDSGEDNDMGYSRSSSRTISREERLSSTHSHKSDERQRDAVPPAAQALEYNPRQVARENRAYPLDPERTGSRKGDSSTANKYEGAVQTGTRSSSISDSRRISFAEKPKTFSERRSSLSSTESSVDNNFRTSTKKPTNGLKTGSLEERTTFSKLHYDDETLQVGGKIVTSLSEDEADLNW